MTTRSLYTCGVNHFLVCQCGAVLGTAYMERDQVECGRCKRIWTFISLGPKGELTDETYITDGLARRARRHELREPVIRIEGDAA